jgi:hypothetical protein
MVNKWPMPDGAKVTMQTNEMTAFTTEKSVKELTEFYTTAMKDAGYVAGDTGMNTADSSMLSFTKDNKTINVIITQQNGKGTVVITQQWIHLDAPAPSCLSLYTSRGSRVCWFVTNLIHYG